MRKCILRMLFTTFATVLILLLPKIESEAAMADNPNIKFHTYTGTTYWTIGQNLTKTWRVPTYKEGAAVESEVPYWYQNGTTITTGIESSLRSLNEGEHYYTWDRTGEIPIGKVAVTHEYGRDIHDRDIYDRDIYDRDIYDREQAAI